MTATSQSVIEDLVSKVRELAVARPETIYQPSPTGQATPTIRCSYLAGTCSDGTVGCLLGQALVAVGYTAEQLRAVDLLGIEEAIEKLLPCELTDEEYRRVRWLESVQNAQDNGHPWGEAIRIADEEEPL